MCDTTFPYAKCWEARNEWSKMRFLRRETGKKPSTHCSWGYIRYRMDCRRRDRA